MNPIADYLAELSPQLRRRGRGRIVTEVRAHLLEAAAAELLRGADADLAARGAVERFGPPAHVARDFNAVRTRPGGLINRVAAVMLASASMATLGTATVWAIEPGASHTHTHHHTLPKRSGAHR